jgi:hypothetical protein
VRTCPRASPCKLACESLSVSLSVGLGSDVDLRVHVDAFVDVTRITCLLP